jgi:hypothetical protein
MVILFSFFTLLIIVFILPPMIMALGYVVQEKYPNRRDLFDILFDFWKNVWRKII